MMNSVFNKSHVYATYSFGRYTVKLWEQLQPNCAMRVGVIVGYVVTNAATGELMQKIGKEITRNNDYHYNCGYTRGYNDAEEEWNVFNCL